MHASQKAFRRQPSSEVISFQFLHLPGPYLSLLHLLVTKACLSLGAAKAPRTTTAEPLKNEG